MRAVMLIIAMYGVLALAGCGGADSSTSSSTTTARSAKAVSADESRGPIPVQSRSQAAKRPEPIVRPPRGKPPKKLVVKNLIRGSGRRAALGDHLAVHLVAIRISGEFFESIWDKPFTFKLGPKDVNPGFVKGLPGMHVGGRRELIVPAALTSRFGVSPYANDPEDSLVYVVDLLEVH